MLLHDPSSLKLPPIKIDKIRDRIILEENTYISNLIKSNILLNKSLYPLLNYILEKSETINQLIESFEKSVSLYNERVLYPIPKMTKNEMHIISKFYNFKSKIGHLHKIKLNKFERDKMEKVFTNSARVRFKGIINSIKRNSSIVQTKLSKFEKKENINLDILTSQNLFFCRNCNLLISKDRFKQKKCFCNSQITKISDTKNVSIAYFDNMMIKFIKSNYWFEYGIGQLLKKKTFNILCGYYILGHSGILHETDIIIESVNQNYRIIGECKTGTIGTNDIFILSGKMTDIGCTRGYIFVLKNEPTKEIKYLARSKNISIISNVINKGDNDILKRSEWMYSM